MTSDEFRKHAHELVVVRSGKTPFLTPRDLVPDVLGLGEHLLKQVSSRATAGVEQLEASELRQQAVTKRREVAPHDRSRVLHGALVSVLDELGRFLEEPRADVVALTRSLGGVVVFPEDGQQRFGRHSLRVVDHLHGLGVPGQPGADPVSYTHLTLPTIYSV